MGKRGKKLDPETKAEIIRLSKGYGPTYIARHLGLHISTVRRHIDMDLDVKVIASRSFQKHNDDIAEALKGIVIRTRSELMCAAFTHFKQQHPEYGHLEEWHDISKEAGPILERMELLADSRVIKFCAKCPICQSIKRQLRESA